MTYASYEKRNDMPTENGRTLIQEKLMKPEFKFIPMSGAKPARVVEKNEEGAKIEEGPTSSLVGSILGQALGLGHAFEMIFEMSKTALEIQEGQGSSVKMNQDVNLNPEAIIRPDLAFNFNKIEPKPEVQTPKEDEKAMRRKKVMSLWSTFRARNAKNKPEVDLSTSIKQYRNRRVENETKPRMKMH